MAPQKFPPRSFHHLPYKGELLIPVGSGFSNICSPQLQKEMTKTVICFYKTQLENTKITWNISLFIFCIICNSFQWCDFTVLYCIIV